MIAYPSLEPNGSVLVRVRAEHAESGTVGDLVRVVNVGEDWGLTWDEWLASARSNTPVSMPAMAK
jgi:hypothetical protein